MVFDFRFSIKLFGIIFFHSKSICLIYILILDRSDVYTARRRLFIAGLFGTGHRSIFHRLGLPLDSERGGGSIRTLRHFLCLLSVFSRIALLSPDLPSHHVHVAQQGVLIRPHWKVEEAYSSTTTSSFIIWHHWCCPKP